MENTEWYPVFFNGIETNVEVTKCGKVRKIKVDWLNYNWKYKLGIVDFSKLKKHQGYMQCGVQIKGKRPRSCQVQQLVAAAFLSYKWQGHKQVVMHLDDDKSNNDINNLKIGTQRENCSQLRTKKSGLPVGVSFNKALKKYHSYFNIGYNRIHLGYYNTPEEASEVYQNKLKEYKP